MTHDADALIAEVRRKREESIRDGIKPVVCQKCGETVALFNPYAPSLTFCGPCSCWTQETRRIVAEAMAEARPC